MQPVTIYGLRCTAKDEKLLMQRVNSFLAKLKRTTSKAKNPNQLKARLPFVLKHYYWNLNKDTGTYVEIYPNEDLEGKCHLPEHPECGWLMMVINNVQEYPAATEKKALTFIHGLLDSIEFEHELLVEKASRG